jgi:hypothetical protein
VTRETVSRGIRGGGVTLSQNFACVDSGGAMLRKISMFEHLAYRFVQYVVLGYILLGLSRLYTRIKKGRAR